MELKNFTYLLLIAGIIIVPIALSFEKELRFYTRLKYLLPAVVITGAFFIIWDSRFTSEGIWSFNPDYITGVTLINLPVEEWLFFLVVPYALIFIYEVLELKLPAFNKPNIFVALSLMLLVGCAMIAYFNFKRIYTFNNFLFLAVYLGYIVFRNQFRQHYYRFYSTFLISLVPFILINWILTSLPVVEYNPDHIIGIRFLTIPVEDFGYLFLLLLMTATIYEFLMDKRYY